jgi:hypothetical protein
LIQIGQKIPDFKQFIQTTGNIEKDFLDSLYAIISKENESFKTHEGVLERILKGATTSMRDAQVQREWRNSKKSCKSL